MSRQLIGEGLLGTWQAVLFAVDSSFTSTVSFVDVLLDSLSMLISPGTAHTGKVCSMQEQKQLVSMTPGCAKPYFRGSLTAIFSLVDRIQLQDALRRIVAFHVCSGAGDMRPCSRSGLLQGLGIDTMSTQ